MLNDDRDAGPDFDGETRDLFDRLPRELAASPGELARTTQALRREGFFHTRRSPRRWALAAAAGLVLFFGGAAIGNVMGQRGSLEAMLARRELSVADRVLLLQRAGSAYVQAAQSYADATAHVDSSAVEVASKVLMGAAHAVARSSLDGGLSARLTSALEPAKRQPVIWY